eukprot:9538393-Alexandrium_andersonii.AAC.1
MARCTKACAASCAQDSSVEESKRAQRCTSSSGRGSRPSSIYVGEGDGVARQHNGASREEHGVEDREVQADRDLDAGGVDGCVEQARRLKGRPES